MTSPSNLPDELIQRIAAASLAEPPIDPTSVAADHHRSPKEIILAWFRLSCVSKQWLRCLKQVPVALRWRNRLSTIEMEWLGRGYLPVAALQLHAADWKALKWPGFQRLLETSQGSLRALENLPSKPDLHSTWAGFPNLSTISGNPAICHLPNTLQVLILKTVPVLSAAAALKQLTQLHTLTLPQSSFKNAALAMHLPVSLRTLVVTGMHGKFSLPALPADLQLQRLVIQPKQHDCKQQLHLQSCLSVPCVEGYYKEASSINVGCGSLDEFALLLLASKVQDLTLVAGFNVTNKGFRIGDTTRLRTAVLDHSLFEFDCGSAPPGMLRFVRRRAQDPLHLKLPAPLTERQFWQLAATDKQVASLEFMHPHDPTGCPLLENPTFQEGSARSLRTLTNLLLHPLPPSNCLPDINPLLTCPLRAFTALQQLGVVGMPPPQALPLSLRTLHITATPGQTSFAAAGLSALQSLHELTLEGFTHLNFEGIAAPDQAPRCIPCLAILGTSDLTASSLQNISLIAARHVKLAVAVAAGPPLQPAAPGQHSRQMLDVDLDVFARMAETVFVSANIVLLRLPLALSDYLAARMRTGPLQRAVMDCRQLQASVTNNHPLAADLEPTIISFTACSARCDKLGLLSCYHLPERQSCTAAASGLDRMDVWSGTCPVMDCTKRFQPSVCADHKSSHGEGRFDPYEGKSIDDSGYFGWRAAHMQEAGQVSNMFTVFGVGDLLQLSD